MQFQKLYQLSLLHMPQLTNIAEMTTGFYFSEESRNIQDGTEEEVTNLLAKLDGVVINPLMKDTLVWNHSKVGTFTVNYVT